ncbi:MAG: hypothetical protein RI946_897, partial [Pseudomonadota bacterium]
VSDAKLLCGIPPQQAVEMSEMLCLVRLRQDIPHTMNSRISATGDLP